MINSVASARRGTRALWLLLCCHFAIIAVRNAHAQDVQLHYDWRHTADPHNNPRNFPSLNLKSFKGLDFGSFLLKLQGDFDGSRHNLSKVYAEVSQTLRFWKPPIFVHLGYTGGLGLFNGGGGGYYLDNAYLVGAAHPFQWQGSWGNVYAAYRHTNFARVSHDPQVSLYWGKEFRARWAFASTGIFWTQNRDQGELFTAGLTGKQAALLVENEIWYRIVPLLWGGSEVRVSRNVYAADGRLLVYPTIGVRYAF